MRGIEVEGRAVRGWDWFVIDEQFCPNRRTHAFVSPIHSLPIRKPIYGYTALKCELARKATSELRASHLRHGSSSIAKGLVSKVMAGLNNARSLAVATRSGECFRNVRHCVHKSAAYILADATSAVRGLQRGMRHPLMIRCGSSAQHEVLAPAG
jgi:hypothetical protein